VCLDVPDEVNALLAKGGVVCSWRDGLRVAPHIYNTLAEIDVMMDALGLQLR
jgi:kynureninase